MSTTLEIRVKELERKLDSLTLKVKLLEDRLSKHSNNLPFPHSTLYQHIFCRPSSSEIAREYANLIREEECAYLESHKYIGGY